MSVILLDRSSSSEFLYWSGYSIPMSYGTKYDDILRSLDDLLLALDIFGDAWVVRCPPIASEKPIIN